MKYALILAGGIGKRMGDKNTPKQFYSIGDKPIVIFTTEKFLKNKNIDKVIIVCLNDYIKYTTNLVGYYFKDNEKIDIIPGGDNRFESVVNGIEYIKKKYKIKNDDIVITHDAVRPFVTDEIINNNIKIAKKMGACTTAVGCIDTILICNDKKQIDSVPNRNIMYNVQTPQTFNLLNLYGLIKNVDSENYDKYTDLSKLFAEVNAPIQIVEGDYNNIKITTQKDLIIAANIYKEQE
jgi:2-C-methyl-D-erythritol 4-phosphate cytidylyltransferase